MCFGIGINNFPVGICVRIFKIFIQERTKSSRYVWSCSLYAEFALSEVFAKGGEGGIELAEKVCKAAEQGSDFQPTLQLKFL